MTFATLILDSLFAGLLLIAVGWLFDGLQARLRRREAGRPADPFADLGAWDRQYAGAGPHLTAARERSAWPR
jgi:hypothetical protein